MSERRATAWVLPGERMPVSGPAAPRLRFERLAGWLEDLGYETRLVLPARAAGVGRRRGTARALLDALLWLGSGPRLAVRARGERPAVVLANSALHAPTLALVRRALGGRGVVVLDAMGLRSLEVERTARLAPARLVLRPVWRLLERLAFASADMVTTVNDAHAELIRERYGHTRVHTVRDAAEAEIAELRPAEREPLGIPKESVAVCFMGSVVCRRLDTLFDAWRSLADDPRLRLVVVGDGPDLDGYRDLAAELGGVSLLGSLPRERALEVVRACDIAYTGSWSQTGFSFKLFEYLALGMPILVEAKPQMREMLCDGENAAFYSGADELAQQVRRLAGDIGLRKRLGAGARDTFLADHTLEARGREFAELLAEAAP